MYSSILRKSTAYFEEQLDIKERLDVTNLKIKEVKTPRPEICCCDFITTFLSRKIFDYTIAAAYFMPWCPHFFDFQLGNIQPLHRWQRVPM